MRDENVDRCFLFVLNNLRKNISCLRTLGGSSQLGKMSHYQLISKLFPSFMLIGVIFIAGFLKESIKNEKIMKEQRKVLEQRVANENALLEREQFLYDHQKFMLTFLEYQGKCHRIHLLLYRDPDRVPSEVKKAARCCPKVPVQAPTITIQNADRAPLNYATVYVFLSILVFLFVMAVKDVSKEIRSPELKTYKLSLKDYASRRASTAQHGSRLSRFFSFPTVDLDEAAKNPPLSATPPSKRSSFCTPSRKMSLAQQLFKGKEIGYTFPYQNYSSIVLIGSIKFVFFPRSNSNIITQRAHHSTLIKIVSAHRTQL